MFGYTVEIDHKKNLVRYLINGSVIEVDHLLNVITRQSRYREIMACNWLFDFRQSKIVASDYSSYFSSAGRNYADKAGEKLPKIALLADDINKQSCFDFFQAVSFNLGRMVDFFNDRKSAYEWLED